MMPPTRVETRLQANTSKPWDTFWSSEKNGLVAFQDHLKELNVVKQTKLGVGNKCYFCAGFTELDSSAINN